MIRFTLSKGEVVATLRLPLSDGGLELILDRGRSWIAITGFVVLAANQNTARSFNSGMDTASFVPSMSWRADDVQPNFLD